MKLRVSDIITTGVNIKFVILLASCFTIMKNISFFKMKMTYCFSLLIMFVGHGRICGSEDFFSGNRVRKARRRK